MFRTLFAVFKNTVKLLHSTVRRYVYGETDVPFLFFQTKRLSSISWEKKNTTRIQRYLCHTGRNKLESAPIDPNQNIQILNFSKMLENKFGVELTANKQRREKREAEIEAE